MTAEQSKTSRLKQWLARSWTYCAQGVWDDPTDTLKVRLIKTLNLTVRSFLNTDLQSRACAMTYRTMLAIVPALALLFAIGRGFGFQTILQTQLFKSFPSQHKAIEAMLGFVDSYLAHASEGIFVGVGIVFLLWTLISLLSNVEDAFNDVWGVTAQRSLWRKLADYTAILIILPVLMICSGGISLLMSTTLHQILHYEFLSPLVTWLLDALSVILSWLVFSGAYMLIPNTKVHATNALAAGILAGSAFELLQWAFVSGQVYVSTYNAIYGSFAFLPLLLIWLQLTWLITLIGALICCSSQNIRRFAYHHRINAIAPEYFGKIALAVMTVIVKRFEAGLPPANPDIIAATYGIPSQIAAAASQRLLQCGLITVVDDETTPPHNKYTRLLQPSRGTSYYTAASVFNAIYTNGSKDFINGFNENFKSISPLITQINIEIEKAGSKPLAEFDVKI